MYAKYAYLVYHDYIEYSHIFHCGDMAKVVFQSANVHFMSCNFAPIRACTPNIRLASKGSPFTGTVIVASASMMMTSSEAIKW